MHEWKATGCVEEDSRTGLYWVMWVCSKCDKRIQVAIAPPHSGDLFPTCKVA